MGNFHTGCLLCGEPLVYFEEMRTLPCADCGGEFLAPACCQNGHYICDGCHSRRAFSEISRMARQAEGGNPVEIARQMMQAAALANQRLGAQMELGPNPVCGFFAENTECLQAGCPFYPLPGKEV